MVARPLAGFRVTGAAMVNRWPGAYLGLALGALLLAGGWQVSGLRTSEPAAFAGDFYAQMIGELDGRSCPSWPVCSLYGRQAVDRHGLLVGSWLMLDRLIHEVDDVRRGPWIRWAGESRLYDPLQRNDFWLRAGANGENG